MKIKTHRICCNPECDVEFKKYKTTDKFCSSKCQKECETPKEKKPIVFNNKQRSPINKVSKKQKVILAKYSVQRIVFLSKPENQICFIDGCKRKSTTIEHRAGRLGFADEFAKENGIPLTLDERFWAGCCLEHNLELENNPELSRKYQLSKIHNGKKEKI